jgi:hypothetical protein
MASRRVEYQIVSKNEVRLESSRLLDAIAEVGHLALKTSPNVPQSERNFGFNSWRQHLRIKKPDIRLAEAHAPADWRAGFESDPHGHVGAFVVPMVLDGDPREPH